MEKVSLCRTTFPPPRLLHFTYSSSSQDCAIVLFKVSWAINLSLLFPFGLKNRSAGNCIAGEYSGLENTKKKEQGEPPNTVGSLFRVYS